MVLAERRNNTQQLTTMAPDFNLNDLHSRPSPLHKSLAIDECAIGTQRRQKKPHPGWDDVFAKSEA